ncbi:MAG: hypothetical protein K0S54_1165 [Alphaproteobacteria bacterium]|jgi:outer membrane protein OmpA-like peptidoglycan-associated protein|nr:hypothetical protein [Alphaproteobacteria bacterium]
MRSNLRSLLLCGVAATAIAAVAPEAAQAQMYSSGPGFYFSLEGRYLMNEGGKVPNYVYDYSFGLGGYNTSKTNAENGWGGKVMLGYRFGNNWDIGVGVAGGWLNGKDKASGVETCCSGTSDFDEKLKVKLAYQTVDFEAGYNFAMGPGTNLRLFGGLRFANFNQKATGEGASADTLNYDYTFDAKRKTKYWGIGPRIGANGQVALGMGGFHVFGGVSGALLFGKFNDKHNFETNNLAGTDPNFYSYNDKKKSKMVPNVAGEIGLGYQFNAGSGSTLSIQAGYGGEAFFGAGSKGHVQAYFKDSDSTDYVMHGPFVRLTATFGPAAMAAVAAPPPAPPPAPKKNYLVFFDFDRSNITADAQRVIQEAATAAKAGNVARVQLTGHTDRSGSDQYNLALGTRRGEAVKQALIRLGIPAASIAVISRGESQPLVPTADGVREPQNRRVEIML